VLFHVASLITQVPVNSFLSLIYLTLLAVLSVSGVGTAELLPVIVTLPQ